MEKTKKTMTQSEWKAGLYTFLMYFLAIAEMGILSGYRFIVVNPAGKEGAQIGLQGSKLGYSLQEIGAQVGWNYITFSVIIFVAVLAYAFWMGFHRRIAGGAVLMLMNLLPLVGLTNTASANGLFTFFWSYGTAHVLPFMTVFGLNTPADPNNRVVQIIFMVLFAILAGAAWVGGRLYRNVYAEKYEFDLSVPLT
jgi:hypothetical protein